MANRQHVHATEELAEACDECQPWRPTGNQAALGSGCICDSGCPSCDALTKSMEASYSFADGLGKRHMVHGNSEAIHALSVVFVRGDALTEPFEAMREALAEISNQPCAHDAPFCAREHARAALALADRVKVRP